MLKRTSIISSLTVVSIQLAFSISCSKGSAKLPAPPWPCGTAEEGPGSECQSGNGNIGKQNTSTASYDDESIKTDENENELNVTQTPTSQEEEVADPDVLTLDAIYSSYNIEITGPANKCVNHITDASCSDDECKQTEGSETLQDIKKAIWDASYQMNAYERDSDYYKTEASCRANVAIAIVMTLHSKIEKQTQDGDYILSYDDSFDTDKTGLQRLSIFNLPARLLQKTCRINCERYENLESNTDKKFLNKEKFLTEAVLRLNESFNQEGLKDTIRYIATGTDKQTDETDQLIDNVFKITSVLSKTSDLSTNKKKITIGN